MTWYILKAIPGRERAAAADVAKLGDAYVPYEVRYVRGRERMGRPVMRPLRVPIMPGYMFARFPGAPPWMALSASHYLSGVLTRDLTLGGDPATLTADDIQALRAMAIEHGQQQRGDRVRITAGPYRGWESRVEEIRGMMVTLHVLAFNKLHRVRVRADQVERVA